MNAKEAALFAALERHLPSPEWALLAQVGNGTGYGKTPRYIDALALNLVEGIGPKLDTMKQMLAQGRGSAQQRERFEFVTVQYEMAVNELERRS